MKVFMTGGHGGIGSALRGAFAGNGYAVTAPRSAEVDLKDSKAIARYFAAHSKDFDGFVHCAGINQPKAFDQISAKELQDSFAINSGSFVQISQIIAPSMKNKKSGFILAISSLYGFLSRENRLAYATSKHGLNGAVKSLALELGPFGIIVNSLSPGFIDTPMTRKNNSAETIQGFAKRTALCRLGTPEDMAQIALFLCGPDNRYITGQDIVADGGYSIGGFQNL